MSVAGRVLALCANIKSECLASVTLQISSMAQVTTTITSPVPGHFDIYRYLSTMVRKEKDVKPVIVNTIENDGQVSYVIQGGLLPHETAWIPRKDMIVSNAGHDFLRFEANSSKLATLLGITLRRNNAFVRLHDLRNDACKAVMHAARIEQQMQKDRVTKRGMTAWKLINCVTVRLPGTDDDDVDIEDANSVVVMKFETDLRGSMCISLDTQSITNIVKWMNVQDPHQALATKGSHHTTKLGDGVSYNSKTEQMWCYLEDEDGMKRRRVKKMKLTMDDLENDDVVCAAKDKLWEDPNNNDDTCTDGAHDDTHRDSVAPEPSASA